MLYRMCLYFYRRTYIGSNIFSGPGGKKGPCSLGGSVLAAAVAIALLCVARQTSPATTTHTNFPSFSPPFIAPCSPEYEGGGGEERRRNGGRSHFRVSQGLLPLLFFTLPLLLPERERDLRRIWKFLFPVAQYVTATCVRYKSSFFYVCICSTFVSFCVVCTHTYTFGLLYLLHTCAPVLLIRSYVHVVHRRRPRQPRRPQMCIGGRLVSKYIFLRLYSLLDFYSRKRSFFDHFYSRHS